MTRIALVAQRDGTDIHTDGPLLLAAFARRGIDAEVVPWGGERDWGAFDAAIIRATWDYIDQREEFLVWAHAVEGRTRLANGAPILEWNADKRYLRELASDGVPTVSTLWIEPGQPLPDWRWDDVVVKPAVSAGARGTARYPGEDRARIAAHAEAITAKGGTAMIQLYLADVDREGEWGTYVFDGRVSHAITKGPVLRSGVDPIDDFSLVIGQSAVAAEVTGELTSFASNVMGRLPALLGNPLYARVDALRGGDGRLVLLELELIEPFFYLETDPEAAGRFARATESWLGR